MKGTIIVFLKLQNGTDIMFEGDIDCIVPLQIVDEVLSMFLFRVLF